tara:strand:+ start:2850 stop:3581 length:732 start_codon:yes stop_codon:yes gene_type:complete
MKFTIIIPCYNAEQWIEESILSALNQTYSDLEVICVDNESTDGSFIIVQKMKSLYPQLIISTAPNLFKYSWEEPVEEALRLAEGKYFTILGADDFLDKNYVTNIVKIIKKSGNKIKLLQSPIRGIKGKDKIPSEEISHSYRSLEEFKSLLFNGCPVTTPSVVYDKQLHDCGIIRWDSKKFLGAVDYELYFHLSDQELFIYPYPKWVGYYYRWHKDQATWGMHQEPKNYDKLVKDLWRKKWSLV